MAKTPKTAAPTAAKATPAPAATAKPTTYTLTEAGAKMAPRPTSKRHAAWTLVVQHAGKPGGLAAVMDAVGKGKPGMGSITGANLMGWAVKAGLVRLGN